MAKPRTPAVPDTRPTAVLVGGPRAGAVYYVDDIRAQREAQRRTGHGIFDYVETAETTDGKTVWKHSPPTEAAAVTAPPVAEPVVPAARRYTSDLDPIPCPTCDEPTLRVENGRHVLVVDVDVVKGGLWRFDSRGRPVRRPLGDAYSDPAATGYTLHECPSTPSASPASKD